MTQEIPEFVPKRQSAESYRKCREQLARPDLPAEARPMWLAILEMTRPLPGNGMIIIQAGPR